MVPDLSIAEAALFGFAKKPVSPIERLLESTDGPMNGSGSMRPAFFQESVGWAALTENMTDEQRATLIKEREGERLAMLDWVRSGASRDSYERDNHGGAKIKTIINDRCASCHSEEGRNDKARWFPLDAYEKLEPYCQPESIQRPRPKWLFAAILLLVPLALFIAPIFNRTSSPHSIRVALMAIPVAALAGALSIWLLGQPSGYAIHAIVGAIAVAAIGVMTQIFVSLRELMTKEQR
jgi:hypothetical protein